MQCLICTDKCPFFESSNMVFTCRAHGHVHVCGDKCNAEFPWISTEEGTKICPVSGCAIKERQDQLVSEDWNAKYKSEEADDGSVENKHIDRALSFKERYSVDVDAATKLLSSFLSGGKWYKLLASVVNSMEEERIVRDLIVETGSDVVDISKIRDQIQRRVLLARSNRSGIRSILEPSERDTLVRKHIEDAWKLYGTILAAKKAGRGAKRKNRKSSRLSWPFPIWSLALAYVRSVGIYVNGQCVLEKNLIFAILLVPLHLLSRSVIFRNHQLHFASYKSSLPGLIALSLQDHNKLKTFLHGKEDFDTLVTCEDTGRPLITMVEAIRQTDNAKRVRTTNVGTLTSLVRDVKESISSLKMQFTALEKEEGDRFAAAGVSSVVTTKMHY